MSRPVLTKAACSVSSGEKTHDHDAGNPPRGAVGTQILARLWVCRSEREREPVRRRIRGDRGWGGGPTRIRTWDKPVMSRRL